MDIMPISKRDMNFLIDRLGLANDMRIVTVRALLDAIENPLQWAVQNYAKNILLLGAKIYEEYMQSMEDVAALIHAVRERIPNGITYEYVTFESTDVGALFAEIDRWKSVPSIDQLLRITEQELDELKLVYGHNGDVEAELRHLNEIPLELKGIAQSYRSKFESTILKQSVPVVQPDKKKNRAMKMTHNKIKHGACIVAEPNKLLVRKASYIESSLINGTLNCLIQAPNAEQTDEPLMTTLPMTPERLQGMAQSVQSMRNISKSIASLVITLLDEGIWHYDCKPKSDSY